MRSPSRAPSRSSESIRIFQHHCSGEQPCTQPRAVERRANNHRHASGTQLFAVPAGLGRCNAREQARMVRRLSSAAAPAPGISGQTPVKARLPVVPSRRQLEDTRRHSLCPACPVSVRGRSHRSHSPKPSRLLVPAACDAQTASTAIVGCRCRAGSSEIDRHQTRLRPGAVRITKAILAAVKHSKST
jgi:hypothetical protein